MSFLSGYKTIIAAIGLLGLGVYQVSQGNTEAGFQSIAAALAAFGLRSAIAKVEAVQAEQPIPFEPIKQKVIDGNPPIALLAVLVAMLCLSPGSASAQDCANGVCTVSRAEMISQPEPSISTAWSSSSAGNSSCQSATPIEQGFTRMPCGIVQSERQQPIRNIIRRILHRNHCGRN
jgi:hypothetical protein